MFCSQAGGQTLTTTHPRPNRRRCGQRSCQAWDRLRHDRWVKCVDVSLFNEEGRLLPNDIYIITCSVLTDTLGEANSLLDFKIN